MIEPQFLNDLLLVFLHLLQVKIVIVDVVASFIAVLGSIMLPMIDKLFCLRIVLLQDFLQHSD